VFKFDVLLSTALLHHTVGVPIKLLHEAEKHVVTVELKNGEIYKGLLAEAEDTMNCQMKEGDHLSTFKGTNRKYINLSLIYSLSTVIMTARDGRILRLENVFLRGAQIKFIVLPELLKNASILKKIQGMKAKRVETEGGGKPSGAKKTKHVRF